MVSRYCFGLRAGSTGACPSASSSEESPTLIATSPATLVVAIVSPF